MNTVELQNNIIRLVLDIKDEQLLQYLNSFLQTTDFKTYILNDNEMSVLMESKKELANGKVIDHDELISRNRKWLEE